MADTRPACEIAAQIVESAQHGIDKPSTAVDVCAKVRDLASRIVNAPPAAVKLPTEGGTAQFLADPYTHGLALPSFLAPDACTIEQIAICCHEANRAYCLTIGDGSQRDWLEADQWQRDSAIDGVTAISQGKVRGPQDSHERWLEVKRADGWTFGPEKDSDAKTHPCMVEYAELPERQRVKDMIFWAIANAMLGRIVPPSPVNPVPVPPPNPA